MYCKTCGLEQSDVSNYCTHDGSSTGGVASHIILAPKDSKYCRTCGVESKETATYCEKCGDSLLVGITKKRNENEITRPGCTTKCGFIWNCFEKRLTWWWSGNYMHVFGWLD